MDQPDLPRINAELASLMREKLGVRGSTLADKVRRAGRLLPRPVRAAAQKLIEAERLWPNPKLRRQIDPATLTGAAKQVHDHLSRIDRADRRRAYWLSVLTPLAFNLLVVLALVTAWVAWYG